jgi:transcriptional regulator GlxA family with amidase domain
MQYGLLAGLAHPQVAKVLLAIHETPERQWGLEAMAELALMSRSKFAELFKRIVGQSPGDYVIEWRIIVAQGLLKQNKPVALVANAVGYENGSALARIFRKKLGMSPKQWLDKKD